MKKELKLRLDKYSSYLQSAYYANYSRQLTRNDLTDLVSIYEEHLSTKFTENLNCGVCVLGLLKRLGRDYFNYEEPIKIEENVKEHSKRSGDKKTKNTNNKELSS